MTIMRRFMQDPSCILAERFTSPQDIKSRYGDSAVGGNPTVVDSKYGHVMRFDGAADFLNLGRPGKVVNISNPFTVIVLQRQISQTNNATPLSFGIGAGLGFMLYQNAATHMNFWVMDYAVDRSLNTDPVTVGKWELLTGVSTDTTTTIYVDSTAKPAGTKGAGALAMPVTNPIWIGAYSAADDGTPDFFYNGDIALAMIFKREWSTQEIENLSKDMAF